MLSFVEMVRILLRHEFRRCYKEKAMKGKVFLRCFSAVLIVFVSFSFTAAGGEDGLFLKIGINPIKGDKKAPDFSLKDLKGEKVGIKQFDGKIIFLNFWAFPIPGTYRFPNHSPLFIDNKGRWNSFDVKKVKDLRFGIE